MIRAGYLLVALLAVLAGCGADGPPHKPGEARAPTTTEPGVSISGEVLVGVSAEL